MPGIRRIEHKGYVVTQDPHSHHVMISLDGHMVMHCPCTKPKTDDELREMVDFYLIICGRVEEMKPLFDFDERQESGLLEED